MSVSRNTEAAREQIAGHRHKPRRWQKNLTSDVGLRERREHAFVAEGWLERGLKP